MKAIFATTQNFLLGLDGTMPWRHSEKFNELGKMDMTYFRELTKESKVVMGYNTWVSIGQKPLQGRKDHYIITTKKGLIHEDSRVRFMDLKTFLNKYSKEKDIICIGGGKIYKELLPYFTEIYWNELILEQAQFRKILNEHKDKVYLSRRISHILENPLQHGFRQGNTIMNLDSQGNSITYKRYIRRNI